LVELDRAVAVIEETRERVRRAYGPAIGRHRRDVITPALMLDIGAARRNIDKMARTLETMPARIRPHIKVHKSPELSRMQVDAGAIGISTATVWEAIVMVQSGLDGIFIVNTVAGREKLEAIAKLSRDAEVMVAVDDANNAADVAAAARAAGSTVGVLIEVDTGMDRAGVDTTDEAIGLGRLIAELKGVNLLGVTGYEGHCSRTAEADLRAQLQGVAMSFLVETAEALRGAGLPCPIVSAGGTATWNLTAATPGLTEIQAGSYVVMDNYHGAMVGDFEKALTVTSTVISRPAGRVILDAGNKSLGAPALTSILDHTNEGLRFDEEHAIFASLPDETLRIGDVVDLIPGYSPATVNWYDAFHVVEDDRVVDIWPVIPRGPGHGGLIS
jgi:D-serine deaminase-like pyridoxal phosphate-dependent protein